MATILIVDDYSPNHRLLSFVLEQSGYAVVTALDGQQALERLAELPVDLIVTDLTMPKMDGLALVEHVRGDTRYCGLPVIMLTASSREQDQVRARGAGVSAFLTKPFDSEELVTVVNREMERERPVAPELRPQLRGGVA